LLSFYLRPNTDKCGFSIWQAFLIKLAACDATGNKSTTSSWPYP
jgi:hypothetical protein